MKYYKVRPNSYAWLKWVYFFYYILLFILVSLFAFGINQKDLLMPGIILLFIGLLFITKIRSNVVKSQRVTRHIQNHILENNLCKIETKNQREKFSFYPKVSWKIDEQINTLYIRFRLTGNKVNLRGLEQGLADRLEKACLNVFEGHGFIEYLFEWQTEERLTITSKNDIKGKKGDSTIALSPTFLWDYHKVPHFLIAGTTGTGKTTFVKLVIANLIENGVRIFYVDLKRDRDMENFCNTNTMISYSHKIEDITKTVAEVSNELISRTKDIEHIGISSDFNFLFPPIYLICDEIILMKLKMPKKSYEEMFAHINSIIVSGRSYGIFCGQLTQSALAEYLGNSGIRNNIGLKVGLGQMGSTELGMLFGGEFSSVKNLRYEIGAGLIMRTGVDSRPREFIVPYVKKNVFD